MKNTSNKYFDKKRNALIFLDQKATSAYWDNLWQKNLKEVKNTKHDFIVLPTTKKFLKKGSKILEGGCGHGTFVYYLNKNGYDCTGVDFAKKTVQAIRQRYPNSKIEFGDLNSLKYSNNSFDGYWSIGVIEHFYNGYEGILKEMNRVIKPGGYLFISFPYMSRIRLLKSKLKMYPQNKNKKEPQGFYQFALNPKKVINNLENAGFSLVKKKPYDGFRGMQSEMKFLKFILNPIDNLSKKSIIGIGLRFLIARIAQPFAGHCILLVFKKNIK